MAEDHAEIACHILREGMYAVRLNGGPWDGKEVGVRDPKAERVRVNGPRHGCHSIWITHLYERHGECFEFLKTEIDAVSAWRVHLDAESGKSDVVSESFR
jgi:hypothetical protein